MDSNADAVVIGGGIFGASAAHFLAKKGFGKIVLLEKRSLAAVSTGHSAANVRTYYSNPMTVQLAWKAVQMFESSEELLGGDCGFDQIGFLLLIDEENRIPGKHILEMESSNGVEVKDMSVEDLKELAPDMNTEGLIGGIYEVRSGYADPIKTTKSLAHKAKDWGLKVYEGVEATGISLEGDRVTGVSTSDGFISTPVVINAAGPWGNQVGSWVGLNHSIRWSRETDMAVHLPPNFGRMPVVSDPSLVFYYRPQGQGELVAGLGFPKEIEPVDINNYDETLDPGSRHRIESKLFERLPVLKDAKYSHGWASLYTISDDWHPLVGKEDGLQGYYSCFAGSGHCFKLGPPMGEALADMILGQDTSIDITALRPSRFKEGEPMTSAWGGGNRA